MFSGGNSYPLRTSLEWQMGRCRKWRHRQHRSQREIQESWHIGWELDYTLLDSIWFLRESKIRSHVYLTSFCWLTCTFFKFEFFRGSAERKRLGNARGLCSSDCRVSCLVEVLSLTSPLQWQPGVKILSSRSWNHEQNAGGSVDLARRQFFSVSILEVWKKCLGMEWNCLMSLRQREILQRTWG